MADEPAKEPIEQQQQKEADKSVHKEHKKENHHNLREQIDKLQAEKDEMFARLQRLSADYMNYQKRSAKQISEAIAYEKEVIIKSLLPVLDNFEHTLASAENEQDIENLRKGVKIIYEQMLSIFKSYGVEQVSSAGKQFDPACHQAVMQETDADKEDGIILKELMKCYRLGEKVLRPGRVVVNKKAVEQGDDDGSDEDRE
ncbi:MAG: nucleotide exchange factor GrpE [Sedimentisphaerales bacterium]